MDLNFLQNYAGSLGSMVTMAVIYGVFRLFKRSKCASHSRFCDCEIKEAEEKERERTQRASELREIIVEVLAQNKGTKPEDKRLFDEP